MSFDIAALNIVDFAAIIILVVSGVLATLRGMTREVMGLAGWPISILAARLSAPYLAPPIKELIKVEGISDALAWGIPFIIVVILWFTFSSLVSPGLSKAGLGSLDRWLGFLFGLVRGFLIVLIVYAGSVVAVEGDKRLPDIVKDAQITPVLRESAHLFAPVLPEDMQNRLTDNLPPPSSTTEDIQEGTDAAVGNGLDLLTDEQDS